VLELPADSGMNCFRLRDTLLHQCLSKATATNNVSI
jgi:hypothetical protein